jgi:hypothetical protein
VLFAINEWCAESNGSSGVTGVKREISSLDENSILFVERSVPDFIGVVCCDVMVKSPPDSSQYAPKIAGRKLRGGVRAAATMSRDTNTGRSDG